MIPIDQQFQFICEELRGIRTEMNNGFREQGERIAKLEEKVKMVIGNGQPGLIQKQDEKIEALDKEVQDLKNSRTEAKTAFKYTRFIVASGTSAVVAFVITYGAKIVNFLAALLA